MINRSNVSLLFEELKCQPFALSPHTLASGRAVTKVTVFRMRGRSVDPVGESLVDEPHEIFVHKVEAFAGLLNRRRPGVISMNVHNGTAYVYERPIAGDRASAVA
jgi:hypothetical protein